MRSASMPSPEKSDDELTTTPEVPKVTLEEMRGKVDELQTIYDMGVQAGLSEETVGLLLRTWRRAK